MTKVCECCHGDGVVECLDCNGLGTIGTFIQDAKLDTEGKHYKELLALQRDAHRVIRQARELSELVPTRVTSYHNQLVATLKEINRQADALDKPSEKHTSISDNKA